MDGEEAGEGGFGGWFRDEVGEDCGGGGDERGEKSFNFVDVACLYTVLAGEHLSN